MDRVALVSSVVLDLCEEIILANKSQWIALSHKWLTCDLNGLSDSTSRLGGGELTTGGQGRRSTMEPVVEQELEAEQLASLHQPLEQ